MTVRTALPLCRGFLVPLLAGLLAGPAFADLTEADAARAAVEAAGGKFNRDPTELSLSGPMVDDALLATLDDLDPPLTKLSIRDGSFTEDGLASLASLTELETLSLRAPTLTDAGVAPLAALTNLRDLTLRSDGDDPPLTPAGLAPLKALTKVESLGIGGHDFPADVLLTVPDVFPKVRSLDLNHTFTTDAAVLKAFARLSNLIRLQLGGNVRLSEEAAGAIGSIRTVETLGLVHAAEPHTKALFDSLEGHPNLRDVTFAVRGDGLTDERVETLLTIPALESVKLGADKGPLTDAAAVTLGRLPNLKEFALSHPSFTDAAVQGIAKAPKLERLTLDAVNVTEDSVRYLAEMPNLQVLSVGSYFRSPPITDSFVEKLEALTGLKSLTLYLHDNATVSDAALERLKAALPETRIRIARR